MPNIRRCYNEKCKYNLYGICDGVDIVIDSDGCCEDFSPKKNEEEKKRPRSSGISMVDITI